MSIGITFISLEAIKAQRVTSGFKFSASEVRYWVKVVERKQKELARALAREPKTDAGKDYRNRQVDSLPGQIADIEEDLRLFAPLGTAAQS